jgi:peptide/nickel transport system permease protein
MTDTASTALSDEAALAEQKRKEAYFTAGQLQLIWARFKKNRSAMVGGFVLISLIGMGIFAPFLSPYDPTIAGRDKTYQNGAPQIPYFWDENGFSVRPFVYSYGRTRSAATNFRWVSTVDKDKRRYVELFVKGWEYHMMDLHLDLPGDVFDVNLQLLKSTTHLFGVDEGQIHIFGTDGPGKDIFSRTLHAIYTSLAVGTIGVFIAFVLALVIGGLSGYYGGWTDSVIQMITDAVRTVPAIPLFMALAAFVPDEWSAPLYLYHFGFDWLADPGPARAHASVDGAFAGLRLGGAALRRLARPCHPQAFAAQFHQLHHRRSGDFVPLHGAQRNSAQLHWPGPQGPGQLTWRDAAERH